MKKHLVDLVICIVSLVITFVLFEALSWYHFGDMPTTKVLSRLIIFFILINFALTGVFILIKKLKK